MESVLIPYAHIFDRLRFSARQVLTDFDRFWLAVTEKKSLLEAVFLGIGKKKEEFLGF